MKKKMICIVLTALLLTACNDRNTDGNVSETTSLTLTESITEDTELLEQSEPLQTIEFAIFDPFGGRAEKYKDDIRKEMMEASEKVCDAMVFLDADVYGFYEKSKYYSGCTDTENPLEEDPMGDYRFCPLNTDIAADEDGLYNLLRGCFTENYISDSDLYSRLFENEEPYVPKYKTIDGTLCMIETYMGMSPIWHFDETTTLFYDGTTAEIAVYAPYDPAKMAFINMERSEEYGWRLDSFEEKDYCPQEANILYNALVMKTDTLNRILYGGNTPENAKTIEIDGVPYTETDLDMTVEEMTDFFAGMFEEDEEGREYNRMAYIDAVFAERDGVLYRRNDKPRRYMPELKLSAFTQIPSAGGIDGEWTFSCTQEFYDSVKDESFSKHISMLCGIDTSSYNEAAHVYERYYYLHIDSQLPIREYE